MRGDLAGGHVADNDALGVAIHDHEVHHLGFGKHFDVSEGDLVAQCRVGSEKELLAGLAAGVERARDLRPAERAVVEQATVFAGERDPLGDALVDDLVADLGQPVDVGLAGAEVAAFNRVVEEPVNAVAVVLVVFRGIDPALGGDRVGAARAVLVAEALHLVALLGKRGGRCRARQAGADDDDVEFPLVGRVDQLGGVFEGRPLFVKRTSGYFCVECHLTIPVRTETGMEM